MRRSMVIPRTSKRPPGMNPTSLEGPPGGVTWTSAVSNAGMVAAGWPSAALDNKPDKDKRIVRLTLAHVRFIIRAAEPRKAVGRARGIVVSTIETIIQQNFADLFNSVRKHKP